MKKSVLVFCSFFLLSSFAPAVSHAMFGPSMTAIPKRAPDERETIIRAPTQEEQQRAREQRERDEGVIRPPTPEEVKRAREQRAREAADKANARAVFAVEMVKSVNDSTCTVL